MTQHQRIVELCQDGEYHCQRDFHPITWSPHKRRGEIEKKGKYLFLERPCEHGIDQSKDFKMIAVKQEPQTPTNRYCSHPGCRKDAVTYKDSKPVCSTHAQVKAEPQPALF